MALAGAGLTGYEIYQHYDDLKELYKKIQNDIEGTPDEKTKKDREDFKKNSESEPNDIHSGNRAVHRYGSRSDVGRAKKLLHSDSADKERRKPVMDTLEKIRIFRRCSIRSLLQLGFMNGRPQPRPA